MSKENNLKDFLTDLYAGIVIKKSDASRNPQDFRGEIEAIETSVPWDKRFEITGEPSVEGEGGGDSPIIGTWVFEEITTFLHDVDTQEEYENSEYWQEYPLSGYSIVGEEVRFFNAIYCYRVKGELEGSDFDKSEIGFDNGDIMYENGVFYHNSLTITKEPSAEVVAWIRTNAKEQGIPLAYHLTSVDDLPTDAVDGSLAVVDSDSLVGEWGWNTASPLDLSMFNFPTETFTEWCYINGYDRFLGEAFDYISFVNDNDGFAVRVGGNNLFVNGSWDDTYYKFALYTDILSSDSFLQYLTQDEFKTFIKTNCNRLSGGHTLYSREHGKWINKGEIYK